MNPAVVIPFRPADPERIANYKRTSSQWETLGWPVYAADSDGEYFARSQAINRAAALASENGADVFFIHDCDCLLKTLDQAVKAVTIAFEKDAYVVAFSRMDVFDWDETYAVRAGADPKTQRVLESVGLSWGNAFAISRVLFERVKGFDEGFRSYGCEDLAFNESVERLGERFRVPGVVYHLRHPTPERVEMYENNVRYNRYRQATTVEEMQAIIDER